MKNIDAISHVTGKSLYVDDIPVRTGTLYGVVFPSPVAHGIVKHLDVSAAEEMEGVAAVLTAADIPGENQIGGIIPDEQLFADKEVVFNGQPMALVVARDEHTARKACKKIVADIEPLEAVTDAREAQKRGMLLVPPSTFQTGDIRKAWSLCSHIIEGQAESGGQEHLYIETQGAYAYLMENGNVKIRSSTQGPTHVQKACAGVLGIPMHKVEVDVTRLGGGFGGKEDQATAYACMAALAAARLEKPVKVILHRMDDMKMTGKRHPYSADFRIGLNKELKIIAYQATFYQNGGAAADLSPAILDRSLFHSTNTYFVPNTEVTAYSCRTHLPPNTAFRGFGGPQGMYIMESAIAKAAEALNVPARVIQQKNFLNEGDHFQYGQIAKNVHVGKCYRLADKEFQIEKIAREVLDFNGRHNFEKKGLAVMPICFGISFTNKSMNQARSLVHIYQDGSVGVSTGAIEMGQGVNTKILQVAARTLSIRPERIKLETTNTTRVSNTSPTAASSGADLNGKATELACQQLAKRLRQAAANILNKDLKEISLQDEKVMAGEKETGLVWEKLVKQAHLDRVCLSEQGHYATPIVHFDKTTSKGHPFAYHVYGVSVHVAHLDCLRGTYSFDKVLMVHDFGNSMNPDIDLGQVEGALAQGMAWMTLEEVAYDKEGKLLSNSLSTYKVPDIYWAPAEVKCIPLPVAGPKPAILKSKAVGEPPLMYGIGAYFAIQQAIRAFNPAYLCDFDAPMTTEKVLMRLYKNYPGHPEAKKSRTAGSLSTGLTGRTTAGTKHV
ncbi:MAG: xanthine dehydrogenase [Bacteroidia bacterium]|nr:MAG: xanthine dehydrogenase [Bacteroidia bacterium]